MVLPVFTVNISVAPLFFDDLSEPPSRAPKATFLSRPVYFVRSFVTGSTEEQKMVKFLVSEALVGLVMHFQRNRSVPATVAFPLVQLAGPIPAPNVFPVVAPKVLFVGHSIRREVFVKLSHRMFLSRRPGALIPPSRDQTFRHREPVRLFWPDCLRTLPNLPSKS